MSIDRQRTAETDRDDLIEGTIRGLLAAAETPLSTGTISDVLGREPGAIAAVLDEMASARAVADVSDASDSSHWRLETDVVEVHRGTDSYRVRDDATGIVSRAGTRPDALRRLAERIEQYEDGETVGAQIRGINEAELSPAYAEAVEDLGTAYVEPSDRHLYVYVEGQGVKEIETLEQLHRDHRVLGYAVTGQFSRGAFDDALEVPWSSVRAQTPIRDEHFPLSVFKVVAVHPDHQGAGIGTALTSHGMAYLAADPPVVAMLWERESDANVSLAEQYGADRLATFADTSPSKWQCPDCGFDTACTCRSVLYGWGFEG